MLIWKEKVFVFASSFFSLRGTAHNDGFVSPDHKDSFYGSYKQGPAKLTIPNEKEKAEYRYNQKEMKGLVIFVIGTCDWGKCQTGDLRNNDIKAGNVRITINGQVVTSVTDIGGAVILKSPFGMYFEPSANDDYEISINVTKPDSFFRISSIIIY